MRVTNIWNSLPCGAANDEPLKVVIFSLSLSLRLWEMSRIVYGSITDIIQLNCWSRHNGAICPVCAVLYYVFMNNSKHRCY